VDKMTVKEVAALKPKDKPYKKNVDAGLQIRVAPNGIKTWIVQYVIGGKQREYRLARHYGATTDGGYLSLQDARIEATRIRALARDGLDYQVQVQQERAAAEQRRLEQEALQAQRQSQAQRDSLTVTDLFEAWICDGVRRKDGNAELRRSFGHDVLPYLGSRRVKDVTEHDLRAVLRRLVERDVNRLAVMLCGDLTQMFRWAEKRQPWRRLLAECNPVDLLEIEKIVSPEYDIRNERDRVLSDAEIRELLDRFAAMEADYEAATNKRSARRPLERKSQLAILIMLGTLCRVGEMSQARWEHIDFETGEWFIPGEATKGNAATQTDFTVYLSDFALAQFGELKRLTGVSLWCFPAADLEGPVNPKSLAKQIGDRQMRFKKDKAGNPRRPMKGRVADDSLVLSQGARGEWTPHDLRRTGAVLMQRLGVSLEIIDQCQHHVLPGSKTRRHYLHYDYAKEKREAWQRLGDHLTTLTMPFNNVLPLRARSIRS
jgi:integrase